MQQVDSEHAMDNHEQVHNIQSDVVSPHSEHPHERQPSPGRGRTIGILFAIALLLAIVYGIWQRHKSHAELEEATEKSAITSVNTMYPIAGSKANELVLPGNVQAFTEAPIYSRTNGYLRKWYYDIGARVRRGALLAEVETPEVDQQLLQSQAELERMDANAKLAETTSDRWQNLLAKHAVSQQEADQARSNAIAAQAAVDASRADVQRLRQLQSYERITAPFDGIITARNTDIGDLINAGSGSSNPRELFHLAAIGKMRVYAPVPEGYSDRIQDGATATITLGSNPNQKYTGTIVRNANAIDRTTRTLNVEVDVANQDGSLLPGAYVFVHFSLPANANTVTIPSAALLLRGDGPQVGVVRDGKAHLQPVVIGHDYGDSLEIVSGLSANEAVISDPPDSLAEGEKVQATLRQQKGKK